MMSVRKKCLASGIILVTDHQKPLLGGGRIETALFDELQNIRIRLL